MRGPDAGAGRHRRQEYPGKTPRTVLARRMRKGMQRGERRRRTDEHGQEDQPMIVLIDNAGDDAKHELPRKGSAPG